MASDDRKETVADVVAEMRKPDVRATANCVSKREREKYQELSDWLAGFADRIEAAWKSEVAEIAKDAAEIVEGLCLHCDMQRQCAEGEDGMSTTCDAVAKVRHFVERYRKIEKQEDNDECPF